MPVTSRPSHPRRRAVAFVLVAAALPALFAACGSKMDPKECDKLRGEGFDTLNKAQHCNTDADCKASDFPERGKPVSLKNNDDLKKAEEAFKTGQCEEPKTTAQPREILPIYCKQGLCVVREKGAETPPASDIQVQ